MLQSTSLNCRLSVNIELWFLSKCVCVCIYICISIYMSLSCTCTHNLTPRAGIYSLSALEWHCECTKQCEGSSRVGRWPFAPSKQPQEWWLPGDSPQVIMRIIIIENLLHEGSRDEMGKSWCCNALTQGANLHSHSPQIPIYSPHKAWGHMHLSQKISLYDKYSKHRSSFQYSNIWTSEIFI